MAPPSGPTHSLAAIQAKVASGDYVVTATASGDVFRLSLDRQDIEACIAELDAADFYKTMPSTTKPGLMQDVYKPEYQSIYLYVKLQDSPRSKAVVISFKKDDSR